MRRSRAKIHWKQPLLTLAALTLLLAFDGSGILRHGIDNAWMGTFGNVICLGAGAVPMQTYYLHRCGLGLGPGVEIGRAHV